MNYNKSQQQAIRHKDGPMLVLAGPGSGKTAVITQRTKQLIEYENIDPSKYSCDYIYAGRRHRR